jgi:hypothetical protein
LKHDPVGTKVPAFVNWVAAAFGFVWLLCIGFIGLLGVILWKMLH